MNDTLTDAVTDPTAAALASRRDFLKASALASGGLMLGITLTGCAKPAALGGAAADVARARPTRMRIVRTGTRRTS